MKATFVSQTDLFPILLTKLGSEPHARIAACVAYWLQFAKHCLKGRFGLYKEDSDLQAETGKQSAGRLLLDLCRAPTKSKPRRLRLSEPLFALAYGPKPGQHSGRVRWIFETEASRKVLQEALEARQKGSTGGRKLSRPVTTNCPDRSQQNAATLISHTYSSTKHSTILSTLKPGEKAGEVTGKCLQEVDRIFTLWNSCCDKSNKPNLRWTGSERSKVSSELAYIVEVLEISKLSDQVVEERLNVLCNRLDEAGNHLSDSFKGHNKNGLTARSFAMYGRELMAEAEKMLITVDKWAKVSKASDVFK
jgi:hypothetical protein